MIKRFPTREQYEQWLRQQSLAVKDKALKFANMFGDLIPVVMIVEADTSQTGESATAHVFVHPEKAELLKWVVEDFY